MSKSDGVPEAITDQRAPAINASDGRPVITICPKTGLACQTPKACHERPQCLPPPAAVKIGDALCWGCWEKHGKSLVRDVDRPFSPCVLCGAQTRGEVIPSAAGNLCDAVRAAGMTIRCSRCGDEIPSGDTRDHVCRVATARRAWLGAKPSNALCDHADCSLERVSEACEQFQRSIAVGLEHLLARRAGAVLTGASPEAIASSYVLEERVRQRWVALPTPPALELEPQTRDLGNVFSVCEAGGRVYIFDAPAELDGVKRDVTGCPVGQGRGISHTEALVMAAWLVTMVPAGELRLADILAAMKRL